MRVGSFLNLKHGCSPDHRREGWRTRWNMVSNLRDGASCICYKFFVILVPRDLKQQAGESFRPYFWRAHCRPQTIWKKWLLELVSTMASTWSSPIPTRERWRTFPIDLVGSPLQSNRCALSLFMDSKFCVTLNLKLTD